MVVLLPLSNLSFFSILVCCFFFTWRSANGSKFTFINKCKNTVWPGILSNSDSPPLPTTGFELPTGTRRSFQSPTGWSGRFWARTGCAFSKPTNLFTCSTGDCGSGTLECSGAGANPPATLAEFTLGKNGGKDFYDVSLVDGYNLPMVVDVTSTIDECLSTGCSVDLNRVCPVKLRVRNGDACRSACEAFGRPEYCCSGVFSNPNTCQPSVYSRMFKSACPRSYSYAYDDATSTFTCTSADYEVTFCPGGGQSLANATGAGVWLTNVVRGDAPITRKRFSPFRQAFVSASTIFIFDLLFRY
ncbi:Pathogenesis-related thaumatin-like protein [Zostera marina]|uniref:Pathogenesis-related thaumatin-like protein n=2 Tax=Zostera marina TaxID=29655 RepID=A0A0K9P8A5_ZOSMR|nr:Pathogenesis-related thaumatin-like protein [Zostera marina]